MSELDPERRSETVSSVASGIRAYVERVEPGGTLPEVLSGVGMFSVCFNRCRLNNVRRLDSFYLRASRERDALVWFNDLG